MLLMLFTRSYAHREKELRYARMAEGFIHLVDT